MMLITKKQSGFTIVELIVVIVVIAILATITLVSYSYLQNRAADTATAANVKQYVDALEMYAFDHGQYPIGKGICIGAEPVDSYGGCSKSEAAGEGCSDLGIEDGTAVPDGEWSDEFNDSLKKYMGEPNKIQVKPYKNLVMEVGGCKIYSTASSPVYYSGSEIWYDEKSIVTTGYGTSGKAYYISYGVDKGEKCPLSNGIKSTDWLLGSDVVTCSVFGGNAHYDGD